MIFFVLILVLLCMMISGNPEWIILTSLFLFIPINLCVLIGFKKNQYNNETPKYVPPEKESKMYNQTEEEFNEMAITTMYANSYLDDD